MPTFAKTDLTTLKVINRWKRGAADAADDIGTWRVEGEDSGNNWDLLKVEDFIAQAVNDRWHNYWLGEKNGGTRPAAPERFFTDTSYLVSAVASRVPKMDTAPLQDIYAWIMAWHTDKQASRVPPQTVLVGTLERAIMALQVVENQITSIQPTPFPAPVKKCPIELGKDGNIIVENERIMLSAAQFGVIKEMVTEHPNRMSLQQLRDAVHRDNPHARLKTIRAKYKLLHKHISMPKGKRSLGYGIV